MNNNNKLYSTLLAATAFFVLGAGIALAIQREALPFFITSVPRLISFLFFLGMIIAASLAVLALAYGAFRYLISAGQPEVMSDAKDQMFKSVIGLVILLASWLIMGYVNPGLRILKVDPLSAAPGVFLIKGNDETTKTQAPPSSGDLNRQRTNGFTHILYKCATESNGQINKLNDGYSVLVFFYPKKDFGNKDNAVVRILPCVEPDVTPPKIALEGQSYEIKVRTPGVYLYKKPGCPATAYRSPVFISNQESLGEFDNNARCVEIVSDPAKNIYYGAMMHESINFREQCLTDTLFNLSQTPATNPVTPIYSSMTVFRLNRNWQSSGDGATFFSHPFSYYLGGGCAWTDIKKSPKCNWINTTANPFEIHPVNMILDFTGSDLPEEDQKKCQDEKRGDEKPTFRKCPGSINVLGDYLVILYGQGLSASDPVYCQVFDEDAELGTAWITKGHGDLIKTQIIPVISE